MKAKLIIMCGIPGSGKSYICKQALENQANSAVISRDEIRFGLLKNNEDYFAHESEVFQEFVKQINKAIDNGYSIVYADATHISPASRTKLLNALGSHPEIDLIFYTIHTDLETCLERNAMRKGRARVPDETMRNMYKSFKAPAIEELNKYSNSFHSVSIIGR